MEERKTITITPKIVVKAPIQRKSAVQSATPQSQKALSNISLTYNSWLTRFNIQPKLDPSTATAETCPNSSSNPFENAVTVKNPRCNFPNNHRARDQVGHKKVGTLTLSPSKKSQRNPKPDISSHVPSQLLNKIQPKSSKSEISSKPDPLNEFVIGNTIGTGAYATVKYGIHKTSENKVAIKVYEKSKISNIEHQKSVQGEISILSKISHVNIVKLYQVIDTSKFLYIVLEFISGCSLSTLLKRKINRRMEEYEANKVFKELLTGLDYCHSKGIAHRDIKLENILIDQQSNTVKLIDFGFATCFAGDKKVKMFCGTPSYMAPEIVMRKEYSGPPVDIWAAGVVFYVLVTGNFPFKANSDKELYKQIVKCQYIVPDYVSLAAKHFIAKMLCVDPTRRSKASDLLRDQWFRSSSAFSITSSFSNKAEDPQEDSRISAGLSSPKLKLLSNSSSSLDFHTVEGLNCR